MIAAIAPNSGTTHVPTISISSAPCSKGIVSSLTVLFVIVSSMIPPSVSTKASKSVSLPPVGAPTSESDWIILLGSSTTSAPGAVEFIVAVSVAVSGSAVMFVSVPPLIWYLIGCSLPAISTVTVLHICPPSDVIKLNAVSSVLLLYVTAALYSPLTPIRGPPAGNE